MCFDGILEREASGSINEGNVTMFLIYKVKKFTF